jgi:hypothetical protein
VFEKKLEELDIFVSCDKPMQDWNAAGVDIRTSFEQSLDHLQARVLPLTKQRFDRSFAPAAFRIQIEAAKNQ